MLEDFIKYILGEWRMIAQFPVSFIVAVLVIGLFIWGAMTWGYGREMSLLSQQVADYKDKLSGASPNEAKTKIETLISEVAALRNQMQGRRLTPEQRNKIIETVRLPNANTFKVQVVREASAQDTGALANDFLTAFQAAGWQTSYGSMIFGAPAPSGLALLVTDQNNLSSSEHIVLAALKSAQIQFDILQLPSPPNAGEETRIWITGR
jgi:hypothetical protein